MMQAQLDRCVMCGDTRGLFGTFAVTSNRSIMLFAPAFFSSAVAHAYMSLLFCFLRVPGQRWCSPFPERSGKPKALESMLYKVSCSREERFTVRLGYVMSEE